MNIESILKQFELVDASITRAKLPFETNMLQHPVMEVSMYELIKAKEQIENMIKEIGYPRFEPVESKTIYYPPIEIGKLRDICPYCGNPDCGSDHK